MTESHSNVNPRTELKTWVSGSPKLDATAMIRDRLEAGCLKKALMKG